MKSPIQISDLSSQVNDTNCVALILAGGRSSRMGRDKAFMELAGKPVIQWVIDAVKPCCNEIIISANSPEYMEFGYRVVSDPEPGLGPLAGIREAMKTGNSDVFLVISCDTPLVPLDIIQSLLELPDGCDALVPVHGGLIEPLCAAYRASVLPVIEEMMADGQLAVRDLLKRVKTGYLETNALADSLGYDPFLNINTPGQLSTAAAILAAFGKT